MNNYIYANLSTGKISRSNSGGIPIFTIGEQNPIQVYFLDYNKPATYNSSIPPLGDPYTYTLEPVNKASSSLIIRLGNKIDSEISSQSTWSNLPTNINFSFGATISDIATSPNTSIKILNGFVNCSQQPIIGAAECSFTVFVISGVGTNSTLITSGLETTYTLPYFFSIYDVTQMADSFASLVGIRTNSTINSYSSEPDPFQGKAVYQTSDSSYAFSYRGNSTIRLAVDPLTGNPSQSTSTSTFVAASGKYSNLDFTNPAWETILGSNDETEIWIDAILDNKVVAQGPAILRKKLSV